MQFIRGVNRLPSTFEGCVLTIGNFDGVHLGHQAVIRQVVERSKVMAAPSVVMSFEPQPKDFFQPASCLPRLTRLREKIRQLTLSDVDIFLLMRFDKQLASLSAEDFVTQILVGKLAVRHVVVGDDFRFGQGRKGDFNALTEFGKTFGFSVSRTVSYQRNAVRVSSTQIRNALSTGDLAFATELLGRPYSVFGRIAHGQQRGRTIGFPTANLPLLRPQSPVRGVFVVLLSGIADKPLPGVANIGNRPTVQGDDQWVLEVHLFDFDQDIYGRRVQVQFLRKLREEQRFDSFAALQQQIELDAGQAKQFFGLT